MVYLLSCQLPALENVIDGQRIDGAVRIAFGQDLFEHGHNKARDTSGAFKEDTRCLLTDAVQVFGAEVVFDKRGQFVKGQSGQFFAHHDTSPQRGNGLKPVDLP